MSYILFVLSKICAIVKVVAVKSSGNIASGAKNGTKISLIRSLGCIIVGAIVCAFSGFRPMTETGIWISVLSGVSNAALLFFWILAATSAPLYFVELFCMIGGVVLPLLISTALTGETVGVLGWVGSAILLVAAFLLSKRGGGRINVKTFLIAIMAGLGNMGSVMTQKLYNTYSGGTVADFQLATYAVSAAVLALLLLAFCVHSRHTARKTADTVETVKSGALRGRVLLFISVAIVMMYISQFLSTYASASIPSAVFYPLSYVISMPLIYFCDVVIYKERVTLRGALGIILVTLAGVLINLKP